MLALRYFSQNSKKASARMSEKSPDVLPCTAFEFDMKGTNLYVAVLGPDIRVLLFQITFKAQ